MRLRFAVVTDRIATIMPQRQSYSRGGLGRRVCTEFELLDHSQRPELAGCVEAQCSLGLLTVTLFQHS